VAASTVVDAALEEAARFVADDDEEDTVADRETWA
jgi:hypothetical protein